MKATRRQSGQAASRRVQDRVGDLARVHDHHDAAGYADDQRHPEQVAGAVDEGVDEGVLVHLGRRVELRDEEGQDRHAEEQRRHLAHPPAERDHAIEHHREGQPEQREDDAPRPGELGQRSRRPPRP